MRLPSRRKAGQHNQRSRGQSLVEFALVLPMILLLMLIAIDFGRVFLGWVALNNSARVAANFAGYIRTRGVRTLTPPSRLSTSALWTPSRQKSTARFRRQCPIRHSPSARTSASRRARRSPASSRSSRRSSARSLARAFRLRPPPRSRSEIGTIGGIPADPVIPLPTPTPTPTPPPPQRRRRSVRRRRRQRRSVPQPRPRPRRRRRRRLPYARFPISRTRTRPTLKEFGP